MLIVKKGVGGIVTAAANIAADETDPEINIGATDGAFVQTGFLVGAMETSAKVILGVPADRAPTASPFLETGTVEDVLTEYSEQSCRLVHSF